MGQHHCPLCNGTFDDFKAFSNHARPCIKEHGNHPAVKQTVRRRGFDTVDELLGSAGPLPG